MRPFPLLKDPTYTEKEQYTSFDNFWLSKIRDKRDLQLVSFTIRLILLFIPLAIILYLPLPLYIWIPLAVFYSWMNIFRYKSRFTLLMHITSHRPWFKSQYSFMNRFLPWILGPFMGQSPEAYFSHHIGMHHIEGNLEDDDSTTMHYQRDSKLDFSKYLLGFLFFGLFRLTSYYNKKQKRLNLRNNAIIGELLFIGMCVGLSFLNWKATLVVFILPFITTRITMMLGNWSQHSFVDPEDPGNEYKNSITCVNHKFNQRCWNDGYHISHHVKPSLHWTDHPKHLTENKEVYAKNKAIVFEGIEFGGVWYYLMKKDYDKLASHVVNINNTFSSKEEIIALLKKRTQKIEPTGLTMEKYQAA
ncbi:MAG: fatty acid desaturase [Chitinophagales bacterium]|nr:fatty acid desaturase [Chitinophagales bacterium]